MPRLWEAFIAQGEEKEKAIELALESLSFLEKQIEGKSFFGGDEIGYLDLVVGWISYWLNPMEKVGNMKLLDSDRFPSLYKWSHNFIDTTPIRECLTTLERFSTIITTVAFWKLHRNKEAMDYLNIKRR